MLNLILLLIQIANILCIIFVLFFERQESMRRFTWILLLAFLPGAGMIFYILFSGHLFAGTRRMHQVKQATQSFTKELRRAQKEMLFSYKKNIPNDSLKEFLPLINMNLAEGKSLLALTDSAVVYTSGKEFFEDLCLEIENAKSSICMEYFIFHKDKIGTKIMEILCKKAQEGVDVKLIYDDLGSISTPSSFFRKLNKAGGRARPFFQIRLGLPLTLNYRNHRKLSVIDSKKAFIGGVNIGDEYANMSKRCRLNWRDTVVCLTGSTVFTLQLNFLSDWYSMDAWNNRTKSMEEAQKYFPPQVTNFFKSNGGTPLSLPVMSEELLEKGKIPTQIITAGPNEKRKANIEDSFIRMIMSAKKNIFIQTPYFTPDEGFYTALKLASYSGVKIKIIIPRDWDKFYMKAASFEFARELCQEGVSFYLYPGFIHSKMITVDGKISSIGTTNIDIRSFSLHFEENAVFYDPSFSLECEKIFKEDLEISRNITKAEFDRRFILKRAFGSFCKLFSPLM